MKLIYAILMLFLVGMTSVLASTTITGNVQLTYTKGPNTGSTGSLIFSNSGIHNSTYTLSVSDLTGPANISGNLISISDNLFLLNNGSSATITFTPANPGNAPVGLYTGLIYATETYINESNETATASYNKTITLNIVSGNHRISIPSTLTFTGDYNTSVTNTFIISNSGDFDEALAIAHNIDPKYNPVIVNSVNVNHGSTASVSLTITVPQNESSVTHQIGTVHVTGNSIDSAMNIYISPQGKLIINSVKVKVDGKSNTVINAGKIAKKAKPGNAIEISLELKNMFSDAEDIKIEDIQAEITVEGIDDGDDLEFDSDTFDLSPQSKKTVKFNFDVPKLVDADTYTILLHADGEDENGEERIVDWEIYLEVEKDTHSIELDSTSVSPSIVSCSRNANVDVRVINTGDDDEDHVSVEVISDGLNFDVTKEFSLYSGTGSDAEETLSFPVNVDSKTAPGSYPIDVNVYRGSTLEASETLDFSVQECAINYNNNYSNSNQQPGGFQLVNNVPQPPQNIPVVDTSTSFRDSNMYLMILGAVALILLLGVVLLFFI